MIALNPGLITVMVQWHAKAFKPNMMAATTTRTGTAVILVLMKTEIRMITSQPQEWEEREPCTTVKGLQMMIPAHLKLPTFETTRYTAQ
jgi:hypothetical protein